MEATAKTNITVQTTINAPASAVWENWVSPEHIIKWNSASDDWHTPYSENNLTVGGTFKSTMAAKDGSMSFDFGGVYTEVEEHSLIAYTMGDGRKVKVTFSEEDGKTHLVETFEAESTNPLEMQQAGWQAILDNFKRYVESN